MSNIQAQLSGTSDCCGGRLRQKKILMGQSSNVLNPEYKESSMEEGMSVQVLGDAQ